MKINKDTKLCISISQYPSNFGTTIHNAAFKSLKLNYIYKACEVSPGKLPDAMAGIIALKIRGCAVSMPFKEEAIRYCDQVEKKAKEIGAINTIVNDNGKLRGFNTDYYGVLKSLEGLSIKDKNVVLIGAGGVARAIICALKQLRVKQITIYNRTFKKSQALASKYGCKVERWEKRDSLKGDIFINATPIGMKPNENSLPISEGLIKEYKIVVDLVLNPPESLIIKKARKLKKTTVAGYQISLYQAAKQFELYTGVKAPITVMQKALLSLF